MHHISPVNRNVPEAGEGEFSPVKIGSIAVWPPVVLAPMAGITNAPFRSLCREFGAGLYVSEMVTSRLLAERDEKTLRLAAFGPDEHPRSVQLYGVDPYYMGEAAKLLANELGADHIDMNFGCPVRKVTRKGGGAAIPLKPRLLRNLVKAAVKNAGDIPVTIKFRIGISDEYQTYLETGKIAEGEGCAAVALHGRTAAQLYAGEADWNAIARLKSAIKTIPVLGNGDIWEAHDALRMMRATGCDGVVVGRGCLGRPWLFRDLAAVFDGKSVSPPPTLGEVADTMLRHVRLLCQWMDEKTAIFTFRKHCSWYVKGFESDPTLRSRLVRTHTLAELETILSEIDREEAFPVAILREPRGKSGAYQKVVLPMGYLDELDSDTPPDPAAEDPASGG